MATVRIPPVLRPQTGGQAEVEAEGATVGDVLRALTTQHPDTEGQLFGAEGDLNRYVNVYLNDEDVRVLEGLDTAVSEGDTVVLLPAMAGGSPSGPNAHMSRRNPVQSRQPQPMQSRQSQPMQSRQPQPHGYTF
jgi:MoaD family protein